MSVTKSGTSSGTSTLPLITARDSEPNERRNSAAVFCAQLRAHAIASAPP
ncbi:hypothetical protein H7J50_20070 [Mycobacterium intermedium]|nr:hypothetical protein [Mycobacterium intermedium]MCV6966087.1 hypothetical protein [Mycobacterium intermedium]